MSTPRVSDVDEHKVKLEVFEGPLDLLLYLIKKDELDIHDIPIERITTQYMEYLDLMRMLDLDIAGEFIVMAATLMVIKSRMLLPADQRPDAETEEEDPRWELVRQLIEYKKFKDIAALLQEREMMRANVFSPVAPDFAAELAGDRGLALQDISIFDMIAALKDVLKNAKPPEPGEIKSERFTVADKIEAILSLVRESGTVLFAHIFRGSADRSEIACTFLALLELIRLRQVSISQPERFGPIFIASALENCDAAQ